MAMLQNIQILPLSCQKDGSGLKRETNPLLRTDLIKVAGQVFIQQERVVDIQDVLNTCS